MLLLSYAGHASAVLFVMQVFLLLLYVCREREVIVDDGFQVKPDTMSSDLLPPVERSRAEAHERLFSVLI